MAARLAEVFPTEAAMFAVIVVPMFSPNTMAHAILKGIYPMLSIIRVMAIVADEGYMSVSGYLTVEKIPVVGDEAYEHDRS